MCTKKAFNASKKPQNSFCMGIDEMMTNFCSGSEWIPDCCPQFQRMCCSNTKGDADFMATCEQMKKVFAHNSKKAENK